MPAERTTMRQVREIVRLHQAGVSTRQIGIRVGVAASTGRLTVQRVRAVGMADGIPTEHSDAGLERILFSGAGKKTGHRRCADPDWAAIHQELKRKHVTLTIVWDEYIARYPDGYRYSRFCELYRRLGGPGLGDDAPSAPGRREAVRGLRRRYGAGHRRSADRPDAPCPDLRGGAGGVELSLRRGELDPGARGLDRIA